MTVVTKANILPCMKLYAEAQKNSGSCCSNYSHHSCLFSFAAHLLFDGWEPSLSNFRKGELLCGGLQPLQEGSSSLVLGGNIPAE